MLTLDATFWTHTQAAEDSISADEMDARSLVLLQAFESHAYATPAWTRARVAAKDGYHSLHQVLLALFDSARGGKSAQERNSHAYIASCIYACGAGLDVLVDDDTMRRLALLARHWIAYLLWARA